MVSERPIGRKVANDRSKVEEAVFVELWLQANNIEILEKFRSLKSGDEHKVALVQHPKHGRVILKTALPSLARREWWEYHLYGAIRDAQRELGIERFAVPLPVDLDAAGSTTVFMYVPIPGVNLEEVDPLTFDPTQIDAGSLREDIHRLGATQALAGVRFPTIQDHWDLVQRYLTDLTASGLSFAPDVVEQFAHAFCVADAPYHRFPSVFLHGDLHAANILRTSDGSLALIDWEFARRGHPLEDDTAILLERLAIGGTELSTLIREVQERYPAHAEHVPPVIRVLLIKQLLKRIMFARIRRGDTTIESDYLRVFEHVTGTSVGVKPELELKLNRAA